MNSLKPKTIDYFRDALPQTYTESIFRYTVKGMAALGATSVACMSYPQGVDQQHSHPTTQSCHEAVVEEGETLIDALQDHINNNPGVNEDQSLQSFVDFSHTINAASNTKLPETVLTICLTPDGKQISSISTDVESSRT